MCVCGEERHHIYHVFNLHVLWSILCHRSLHIKYLDFVEKKKFLSHNLYLYSKISNNIVRGVTGGINLCQKFTQKLKWENYYKTNTHTHTQPTYVSKNVTFQFFSSNFRQTQFCIIIVLYIHILEMCQ